MSFYSDLMCNLDLNIRNTVYGLLSVSTRAFLMGIRRLYLGSPYLHDGSQPLVLVKQSHIIGA